MSSALLDSMRSLSHFAHPAMAATHFEDETTSAATERPIVAILAHDPKTGRHLHGVAKIRYDVQHPADAGQLKAFAGRLHALVFEVNRVNDQEISQCNLIRERWPEVPIIVCSQSKLDPTDIITNFQPFAWISDQTEKSVLLKILEKASAEFLSRQRREEERLRTERLASAGTISVGIAHEVNNALSAVVTGIDFLRGRLMHHKQRLPSEQYEEVIRVLEDIQEGTDRVHNVVHELKTYSRGDGGKQALVDVQATIESTLRLLEHEIRRRARLSKRFRNVGKIRIRETRLRQVLLNLVLNAVQAIGAGKPEEHEISISIDRDGQSQLILEISDTGPGIPEHLVDKIFDPFFTTKPPGIGTGLGLSIARGIVQSEGGELDLVVSEAGNGTTFRVTLPGEIPWLPPGGKMTTAPGPR